MSALVRHNSQEIRLKFVYGSSTTLGDMVDITHSCGGQASVGLKLDLMVCLTTTATT